MLLSLQTEKKELNLQGDEGVSLSSMHVLVAVFNRRMGLHSIWAVTNVELTYKYVKCGDRAETS